jgi:hypothetical protein
MKRITRSSHLPARALAGGEGYFDPSRLRNPPFGRFLPRFGSIPGRSMPRFVLPPLLIRLPAAFREQAVEVGEPTVTADEEPKALAVRLARPASVPPAMARVLGSNPITLAPAGNGLIVRGANAAQSACRRGHAACRMNPRAGPVIHNALHRRRAAPGIPTNQLCCLG